MGLGELDDLAYEVSKELINQFGGTGKLEINTEVTFANGFDTAPTVTPETFDNIDITPASTYTEKSRDTTAILTRVVEVFINIDMVTKADGSIIEPVSDNSWLTIYQGNFIDATVLNKRIKVLEVNPIMGGNKVAMYQLKCEGVH